MLLFKVLLMLAYQMGVPVLADVTQIERCLIPKVFFLMNGYDENPWHDITSVEECVKTCSTVPNCRSLTYFGEQKQTCYLRKEHYTPETKGYIRNAYWVEGSINMECVYGSCKAGEYNGVYKCEQCAAGSYSAAGSKECSQCPAGSYSEAGAGECSQCAAGSYSEPGTSECSQCPAGTTSPAGSTQQADCVAETVPDPDEEKEIVITPKNEHIVCTKKKGCKIMFKISANIGSKKVIIPKESVKICRAEGGKPTPDCEEAEIKTIYYYRHLERSATTSGQYVAVVTDGITVMSKPVQFDI